MSLTIKMADVKKCTTTANGAICQKISGAATITCTLYPEARKP
jgi:hypothetical protein